MSVKLLKSVTPSSRGAVLIDREFLSSGKPVKALLCKKHSCAGRNARGVITVRHRGGGHKKRYRIIDFKRQAFLNSIGIVEKIEYDPNRTSFIALVCYDTGKKSYVLAAEGMKVGDKVACGNNVDISVGNCLMLKHIPVGSFVHNIELKPGKGGVLQRAAGTYAQIMGRDGEYVLLRLSSGHVRKLFSGCYATIGVVSNSDNKNIKLGKAGRSRWLGIRPTIRGVAMNPVDHPHGGGEGKTSGGRHPVTPWGVSTKGKKTSRSKYAKRFLSKGN